MFSETYCLPCTVPTTLQAKCDLQHLFEGGTIILILKMREMLRD